MMLTRETVNQSPVTLFPPESLEASIELATKDRSELVHNWVSRNLFSPLVSTRRPKNPYYYSWNRVFLLPPPPTILCSLLFPLKYKFHPRCRGFLGFDSIFFFFLSRVDEDYRYCRALRLFGLIGWIDSRIEPGNLGLSAELEIIERVGKIEERKWMDEWMIILRFLKIYSIFFDCDDKF